MFLRAFVIVSSPTNGITTSGRCYVGQEWIQPDCCTYFHPTATPYFSVAPSDHKFALVIRADRREWYVSLSKLLRGPRRSITKGGNLKFRFF